MPNLEPFNRNASPIPTMPFATIQRDGVQITINSASYELLGSPVAVELSYDKDEQIIGIRPIEASSPIAYPLRQMGNATTYEIAFRAFKAKWNIETSVARRYKVTKWNEYILIDLKDGGVEVTGPRLGQKKKKP